MSKPPSWNQEQVSRIYDEAFAAGRREAFRERVEAAAAEHGHSIPQDDQLRKHAPMFRGLLGYFPGALFEVARHSFDSNEKHNPGQPLQWARGKSSDHEDCIVRHLIDGARGRPNRRYHLRCLAWRALALLQEDCEAEGYAPGVSSVFPEKQE